MLTTCAIDHYTWANALPEGTTTEEGLTIRRFPTVPNDSRVSVQTHIRIYTERPTTLDEQAGWLSFPFRVPGLFSWLLAHGTEYDAVVFSPYLFWTTTVCLPLVAERAVVIPCLHDEVYAASTSSGRCSRRRPQCGSCPSRSTASPTGWVRWRPSTPSPVPA